MLKLSIIIPIYNASRFLHSTLESVERQSERDLEIICVDDGSTDGSAEIIEERAMVDSRIKVIRMESNTASPGACRNVGIRAARGEYVGFVDSDDEVEKDYFGTLYRLAKEFDADMAASSRIILFGEKMPDEEWRLDCHGWNELRLPRQKSWLTHCSGSNWNKIYRRRMLLEKRLSCCEWKHFGPEDNFLTLMAVIMANEVVVTDAVAYRYRQHETNLTKMAKRCGDFRLIELYQDVDRLIDERMTECSLRDDAHCLVGDRVAYDSYFWRRSLPDAERAAFDDVFRKAYPDLAKTVIAADCAPVTNMAFPPQKILFVINQLYKGGAETSLVTFIRNLKPERYEVFLAVYNQSARGRVVSLLDRIPPSAHVFIGKTPILEPEVRDFVSQRHFDLAVSVGEWQSPELVMRYANAEKKAIWLHADISSPQIPHAWNLFAYVGRTDAWLCVSNVQRDLIRRRLPFLAEKIFVVHNPVDAETVLSSAKQAAELPKVCDKRKIIVMAGNLRPAKNYVRAVRVAAALRDFDVDAVWLVAGGLNDRPYVATVQKEIVRFGLADRFLLLGAQENPWKYVARADVFVSTSDTESWCMAVSEALLLGIPVVATATDGVSEQIHDGKNGFLCQFDERDLAKRLRSVLIDGALEKRTPAGMMSAGPVFDSNAEFNELLIAPPQPRKQAKTLFVIDDANYHGGAHAATMRMLKALREKGLVCDVFSGIAPSCETLNLFHPVNIRVPNRSSYDRWFDLCGFREVVFKSGIPVAEKIRKFRMSLMRRLTGWSPDKAHNSGFDPDVVALFCEYDCVCVMSEGSVFRQMVAELPSHIRKIQFIHTFYALWRKFNSWTKQLTADDERIYSKMDGICLIGDENARSFASMYPSLAAKTFSFRNVIVQAEGNSNGQGVNLVTVARLEAEKDFPRTIEIARRLKMAGCEFRWTVYGDGESRPEFEAQVARLGLGGQFVFAGYDKSPQIRMREADLFVLLSHYEGLPNVIYESLIVGTPVFATAVGGIPEQIEGGKTGMLVADDEDAIFEGLREVLNHPERIAEWKRNLKDYRYDNEAVVESFRKLIE